MSSNTDIKQSVGKGASILLLSTVIVKLIGALFKIPLASQYCLGDLGFGYFSGVYDLYTPVYTLAISGFPIAISRVIADFAERGKTEAVGNTFYTAKRLLLPFGIIGSLLFLVLVFPLSSVIGGGGDGIYAYFAITPSLFLCCAISCYRGFYEGHCNMLPSAISNIIEALCKLFLGLCFAIITVATTKNYALAAAAALCGITIGQLISLVYLRAKFSVNTIIKQSLKFDCGIAKILISAVVPAAIVSLSGSLVSLIDTLLVRAQLIEAFNENLASVYDMYGSILTEAGSIPVESLPTVLYGIRSKAFTLYNLVPTLTIAIGVSATPVIVGFLSSGDNEGVRHSAAKVLKLSALIAMPAGFGYFAVGQEVMALLYGQNASAVLGGKMLSFYGIAAIFAGLSIPLCCILLSIKEGRLALINVLVGIAVKIIANVIFTAIPSVNILGAVYGTLLCFAVIFTLHFITLIRLFGGGIKYLKTLAKPFFAAFLCAVAASLITVIGDSSLITFLSIAVAALVYIVVLALLNTFDKEDILSLPFGKTLLKMCIKLKILR